MDPPGVEPGSPTCHAGVIPLDHRPRSGTAGSCTPISRVRNVCLPLGRRPHRVRGVRPGVADLGVEPSHQAYETQSSAGPSAISGDGGSRTHTKRFLRPLPLPVGLHHRGSIPSPYQFDGARSSDPIDPWGSRTPVSAVRGRRPEPLAERAVVSGRTKHVRSPAEMRP